MPDLLRSLFLESQSYESLDQVMTLIEEGKQLSAVPIVPLYVCTLNASTHELASILPLMSPEQRSVLCSLDLWHRDQVRTDTFERWIAAYASCESDEVRNEFEDSPQFSLFLKARLAIATFDEEDPQYPEHDHFFLTDDHLLLIEYDENFAFASELKFLLKDIYTHYGVEQAYAQLFKITVDSFSIAQEDEYQRKKEDLRDYGMIDYYEALELLSPLVSQSFVDHEIKKRKLCLTPDLEPLSLNECLAQSSLVPFTKEMQEISVELSKVQSVKRQNYLRFNFIRLINSTLVFHDVLSLGKVAMSRQGKETLSYLKLGLSYLQNNQEVALHPEGFFALFDFIDLYRFGLTLCRDVQAQLKKALKAQQLEEDQGFLGQRLNSFVDHSFLSPPEFGDLYEKNKLVQSFELFEVWKQQTKDVVEFLPFIGAIFKAFCEIKSSGQLQDSFYMNYNVDDIDFESIILGQMINFILGHFEGNHQKKLGITLKDFKQFFHKMGILEMTYEQPTPQLQEGVKNFIEHYGMINAGGSYDYLIGLFKDHLQGYDFQSMEDQEFKHVGGPVFLQNN